MRPGNCTPKSAEKIASQQNSVNLYFGIQLHIGILVGIFCVLFGILGVIVDVLGILVGIPGVLFGLIVVLVGVHGVLFGVRGVFGNRMVYLLHLVSWMVYLVFSSQKWADLCLNYLNKGS